MSENLPPAPPPPPPPPGGYPGGYAGGPGDGVHVDIPGKGVVELAPFGSRVLGYIIDAIILGIVSGIIWLIFGRSAVSNCTTVTTDSGINAVCDAGSSTGLFLAYGLSILVDFLYVVGLIAVKGQTVGGMVMKIRAVRTADGGLPGWGPAFLRWLIPTIGSIVCCIGGLIVYFSPLFDGNKRLQGWQDKVAKTYVVKDTPQFH